MVIGTEVLLSVFIIATVILAFLVVRLELKMRRFLSGRNGHNLEGLIREITKEVDQFNNFCKDTTEWKTATNAKMRKAIRAIETKRFNSLRGQGGNQSFATAFLDEDGNGVVISSLHARERISVFAKPIKEYASEYELSEEEAEVIERSHTRL